jgi:integrase
VHYNPCHLLGPKLGPAGGRHDGSLCRQVVRARGEQSEEAGPARGRRRSLSRHLEGWVTAPLGLPVSAEGSRSNRPGKLREMGLGSAATVSLAKARELASQARSLLAEGKDPLEAKRERQGTPTFAEMTEEVVGSLERGWRNPKHRQQWRTTLSTYCKPINGLPVDAITTDHVLGTLRPLWSRVPETASRLRGRIEKVLDAARAKGQRTGENPARWRGHLDHLLPARQKLTRGHHKALPYEQAPAFFARLQELGSISARCLEFSILTAARSGEAMAARFDEFDVAREIWTIPATRMKAGREHRVPLTPRSLEIIAAMANIRASEFVFPGNKRGRPLSVMALEMVLRRLKVGTTVHGFRSTFRDWAAEQTTFSHEACELALAHVIQNKVEAAYRRGNLFEKRRELMAAWEAFLTRTDSLVSRSSP